jgi:hypothetical protein
MPNSVLHISYMVHVPHRMVAELRKVGQRADYLAIGTSSHWSDCDYNYCPSGVVPIRRLQEFWWLWRVLARYEVIHAHFMYTLSATGWELRWLKRIGRKLVVHWRGCEARDRNRNMALHPAVNICQDCDHHPFICQSDSAVRRRALAARYADMALVTTPDMKDFMPDAAHFPFFAPDVAPPTLPAPTRAAGETRIVHVTNQPGIEGTRVIERVIARLVDRGFRIRFQWIHDLPYERALAEVAKADLAIGKMKMGYYANAQIESMALGVPTVTCVREEFLTPALRESGFIFTTLDELEATLEYYLTHPAALAGKRAVARKSILNLHENEGLALSLAKSYRDLSDNRLPQGRKQEGSLC